MAGNAAGGGAVTRVLSARLAERQDMRELLVVTLMLFCASLFVAAASIGGGGDRDRSRDGRGHTLQALVYHETTGFRHPSIQYAIEQLTLWGQRLRSDCRSDVGWFTDRECASTTSSCG